MMTMIMADNISSPVEVKIAQCGDKLERNTGAQIANRRNVVFLKEGDTIKHQNSGKSN